MLFLVVILSATALGATAQSPILISKSYNNGIDNFGETMRDIVWHLTLPFDN